MSAGTQMGGGGGAGSMGGSATGALGNFLQMAAAMQAQRNMDQQYRAEMERQGNLTTTARAALRPEIASYNIGNVEDQIATSAHNRMGAYDTAMGVPSTQAGPGMSSSYNTLADQYGKIGAQSRANLGGYSDWQLNNQINQIKTQNALNQAANYAQGFASVFPYQMYDAAHSQDKLAAMGKWVGNLGSLSGFIGGGSN